MIRISKLTDYGIVLLAHLARVRPDDIKSARDLSALSHLPLPTVNKLLKGLSQAGLLTSHRGVNGGYGLARASKDISVADIITALEGPIAFTECGTELPGACTFEHHCPVGHSWRTIGRTIRTALEGLSLHDLAHPAEPIAALNFSSNGTSATLEKTP